MCVHANSILERKLDATNPAEATPVSPAVADDAVTSPTAATPTARKAAGVATQRPGVAPHAVPRPYFHRFRPPLKIADRYLLASVIGGTLRGLCWFAGLLLAFAVISAVRKIVTDQLPLMLCARIVFYQLPRILLFTLPMSVLYGTVQTFSDLSTRGELTALGVGGMSLPRMVRAPLAWGVLLAIFALCLQEAMVPKFERRGKEIVTQTLLDAAGLQQDFLMVDQSDANRIERVIQADVFEPKTRTLLNPSIQIYNEQREVAFDIHAERAQWDVQSGNWIFYNGYAKATPNGKDGEVPLPAASRFTQTTIYGLPNPKLMKRKAITIQEQLDKQNYEMLSISDLRAYLNKQPALLEKVTYPKIRDRVVTRMKSLTFGIHDKIATPLICIALVLIGAPLGVRPQRSGGGFAMGLSLAVLLLYYIAWSWVSQVGKAGYGMPILLAYGPLALTLVIGGVLMKLKSR
jgi:lipopolysaccharide export system permease protein